jgi:hypothetical protein
LDPYNTVFGVMAIVELALIRHLDGVAAGALRAFRPLLARDDADSADLERRFTTVPWGPTAVYTLAWIGLGTIGIAADPEAHRLQGVTTPTAIVLVAFEVAINALLGVLIIKAVSHLRAVAKLHREAPGIDLLAPAPLYAFSRLTSQTALSLLFLVAILVPSLAPAYFADALDSTRTAFVASMSLLVVAAIAIFVLPLYGMHRRIALERERLQGASGARLQAILDELDRDIRGRDLSRADGLNKLIASVLAERDMLAKLPTWPWQAATLRAFVSALLLPVLVYVLARAAERVIL